MRVLIVDDHPVTRDGLRSALSTPDVVFMDVRMPGISGIQATKDIHSAKPDTKVILFTVEESRAAIADAIRAGVSGYLLKDVSAGELIQAAKLALEGKAVIHPT